MEKQILGARAVRFSSRLQVAAFFQTSGRGDRRRTGVGVNPNNLISVQNVEY
jgi:hypothetical protein